MERDPRIIDISVSVGPDMPSWPSDPPFEAEPFKAIADGSTSNVTRVSFGTHTGTHVDPPRHFIDGATGVDEIALDALMGECVVLEDLAADVIDRAAVARLFDATSVASAGHACDRVLFKTRSSGLWPLGEFSFDYVALDEGGADELVSRGVRLVGVDYLSVERRGGGGAVHRMLLEAGVVILEGLDLSGVAAGRYELICLPLKLAGGDGAPARAVLRTL